MSHVYATCARCGGRMEVGCRKRHRCTGIVAELRNARMMVNHGHGSCGDEPDPLHEKAADIIEELAEALKDARRCCDTDLDPLVRLSNVRLVLDRALDKTGGTA